MKKIILLLLVLSFTFTNSVFASTRVKGYRKKNGTYVSSYRRKSPRTYRSKSYIYKPARYNAKYYRTRKKY